MEEADEANELQQQPTYQPSLLTFLLSTTNNKTFVVLY